MFHWQFGSVPEWFGGASLLLAFWIFAKDRQNQARAQVNRVAVWYDNPSLTQGTEPTFTVEIIARNASVLPVMISQVEYSISIWWPGPPKGGAVNMMRGQRITGYCHPGTLPPGGADWHETVKKEVNLEHDQSAVTFDIDLVSIRDNSGRTWDVTGRGLPRRPRVKRLGSAAGSLRWRIYGLQDAWRRRRAAGRRTNQPDE
jgi:hypothetical protein